MIQRCMEEISDCGSSENIVQNEMFGNAAAETEAIEEVSLTAESQENDAAVAVAEHMHNLPGYLFPGT